MARKGLILREKKRQKLEHKYHFIRRSSKIEISKVQSLNDKWEIYRKFQSPLRNSAPISSSTLFCDRKTESQLSRLWPIRTYTSGNGSCMFVARSNKIQLVRINL